MIFLRLLFVLLYAPAFILAALLGFPTVLLVWALTGREPKDGPLCIFNRIGDLGDWLSRK